MDFWTEMKDSPIISILWGVIVLLLVAAINIADIMSSYYGWGILMITSINFPEAMWLSGVMAFLPTALQHYCFSEMYFHRGKHATTTVLILIAAWVIDTSLDYIKFVDGKTAIVSHIMSLVVSVVIFGILSEYIGSYTFNSTMPKIVAEFKRLNQRAIDEARSGGRAVDDQRQREGHNNSRQYTYQRQREGHNER